MEEGSETFDVVVIGGGFAGLSAATQLARARRTVRVVDDSKPRNRFAPHSHGFLAQDGESPHEILGTARGQLAKYPTVRLLEGRATSVSKDGRFVVETTRGRIAGRRIVLAYGMRDLLPEIEGLRELWGTGVFHCPYCHGYEVRDLPLAVLGDGPGAVHQSIMLRDWSKDVTLFTNGPSNLDAGARARLARRGVPIEEGGIARLVAQGKAMEAVEMADGRRLPRRGMLTATRIEPVADLHTRLGCEMADGPAGPFVRVDDQRATSVVGVYAAGDLARPFGSVAFAVADGAMAGSMAHQSLLAEDWA